VRGVRRQAWRLPRGRKAGSRSARSIAVAYVVAERIDRRAPTRDSRRDRGRTGLSRSRTLRYALNDRNPIRAKLWTTKTEPEWWKSGYSGTGSLRCLSADSRKASVLGRVEKLGEKRGVKIKTWARAWPGRVRRAGTVHCSAAGPRAVLRRPVEAKTLICNLLGVSEPLVSREGQPNVANGVSFAR
jgi:hypothetical protein